MKIYIIYQQYFPVFHYFVYNKSVRGYELFTADRVQLVDYMVKFKKKNNVIFFELLPFENFEI